MAIGDVAPVPVPVAGVVGVGVPEETTSYIRSSVRGTLGIQRQPVNPTHPVNSVNNTILDDGIAGQDASPADEEVGTLYRHGHGGAGEGGVRRTVDKERGVRGGSLQEMLAEHLGELVAGEPVRKSAVVGG